MLGAEKVRELSTKKTALVGKLLLEILLVHAVITAELHRLSHNLDHECVLVTAFGEIQHQTKSIGAFRTREFGL